MFEPALAASPVPNPVPVDAETLAAIVSVRQRFPDAPFLTLGQTVLWDEPVKAAFCRLVEMLELDGKLPSGARIVAGVHDTDYFAKLPGLAIRDKPFVVLRHNDGDTRGLWSAAGEISALFGAEVVPSRGQLAQHGVAFHTAARTYPGGTEALLNQETEAPLWRAIVHTEHRPLIAADVRLADISEALHEQLRWAFRQSLYAMHCDDVLESEQACESRAVARCILRWVEEFCALEPQATLSDLYRDLIPKIWSMVRGGDACSLQTTASMELFRFNAETASLPRFRFVDVFLNPATRALASRSYNNAVKGSGIYNLDSFGPGALPFDVVIPGHGRGTLRLLDGALSIETEEPIELCDNCDPDSVGQLAAILERRFGPDIALVGKAVALIPMLAAEFIFVFHEKASGYTTRTQQMTRELRSAGVDLQLRPMLRLKHSAWDALSGVGANFRLPDHLSRAFGTAEISATDFAANWKQVVARQQQVMDDLSRCRAPQALMEQLAVLRGEKWLACRDAHRRSSAELAEVRKQTRSLEEELKAARAQAALATQRALEVERGKGENYRTQVAPLRERIADLLQLIATPAEEPAPGLTRAALKAQRAARAALDSERSAEVDTLRHEVAQLEEARRQFDADIQGHRAEARRLKAEAKVLLRTKLELERSPAAKEARARLRALESKAELERLRLTRDAIWAIDSLTYTNYRPTAWWLPLVSPDGRWFQNMAAMARARLEEF